MPLMPCQYRIDCGSALLTNYSSEGAEPFPPYYSVVYPDPDPRPPDAEWAREGCLYICISYVSQEEADLCAQRQAVLCTNPPGEEIWYSAPATCTAPCPDGSVFYYTVPAGMFIAKTYQAALDQAQAYACEQAISQRFCLGELDRCSCVGGVYGSTIEIDVAHSALTWAVIGALPPGLTLIGAANTATIAGTPTIKGTYSFQIVATDANGNYAIKVYTIQVVQVTTTALPDFVIGTPYSYQLTADGGSGNYNWRVIIGSLPDGLTLSVSGLISGTPTALATGGTLTFEVIDLTCESANRQFFTPRAALVTTGTTTIKTKRGWSELIPSTGALYKTMTWAGYMRQTATNVGQIIPYQPIEFCAGARYDYSGYSQIDIYGAFISQHQKNLSVACNNKPYPVPNTVGTTLNSMLGYCWDDDPGSCPSCSSVESQWIFAGNYATPSTNDFPTNMLTAVSGHVQTPTSHTFVGGTGSIESLTGTENFPITDLNGQLAAWVSVGASGDWSVTLSDEYTDADATASAVVYSNGSAVAENKPNYLSYTSNYINNISSRITHVDYVLNLSNLVIGEAYIARVEYRSSLGASVVVPVAFTAVGTTHQIIGSVPTPAANTSITVRNPSIVFAP